MKIRQEHFSCLYTVHCRPIPYFIEMNQHKVYIFIIINIVNYKKVNPTIRFWMKRLRLIKKMLLVNKS